MESSRVVVAVVAVVVATTAVSGPLVAGVSLASDSQPQIGNDGTLTVDSVSLPSAATIERASYGAANYYLLVPPATVEIGSISGTPTLVYGFEIGALNHTRSTSHFLDEQSGPAYEATMPNGVLDSHRIDQQQYDATASIAVREGDDLRTVASRNVTVEVVE